MPGLPRSAVRNLIALAHGRTSSYPINDIGAIALGRWQFWQLRCRMGAMSFVKVTCASGESGVACRAHVEFGSVRKTTAMTTGAPRAIIPANLGFHIMILPCNRSRVVELPATPPHNTPLGTYRRFNPGASETGRHYHRSALRTPKLGLRGLGESLAPQITPSPPGRGLG